MSNVQWRKNRKTIGGCDRCSSEAIYNSIFCEYHYVYNSVDCINKKRRSSVMSEKRQALDKNTLKQLVQKLLDKFKETSICSVTSEPLFLSINTSLDHIEPVSKRPDLAYEITNLRWISDVANRAKSAMDESLFRRHYQITYIP